MKISSILFLLILTCQNSYSQTTLIPDPNFEQALIDLGYDIGVPNGFVMTDSINSIEGLYVIDKEISDLTGIEDFVSLVVLNCNYNLITVLNLSANINLAQLDCYSNSIGEIDVTNSPALYYLDCSFNELTAIDLTENPLLYHLEIPFNNLTNLDLTGNPDLHTLICDSNDLIAVNLSECTSLTHFNCVENEITSLDISNNLALRWLYITSNQLTEIDVSAHTELIDFFCENNQITMINLQNSTLLNFAVCDNNNLRCINVKNGFNTDIYNVSTTNNPNLECIQVDDPTYATLSWTDIADGASYSDYCTINCITTIEEYSELSFSIYPNPIINQTLFIKDLETETDYSILNMMGELIQNGTTESQINVGDLSAGTYIIQLQINNEKGLRRFVIY